jgi:hypothetical protein
MGGAASAKQPASQSSAFTDCRLLLHLRLGTHASCVPGVADWSFIEAKHAGCVRTQDAFIV